MPGNDPACTHRKNVLRLLTYSLVMSPLFALFSNELSGNNRQGKQINGWKTAKAPLPSLTFRYAFHGKHRDNNHSDEIDNNDWHWLNAPEDDPVTSASFASRSAIPQFVNAFLERERKARGETRPREYTHMIGIPMAECHQLQIELESVQRAILYHCPPLIHACIVPTMSRIPLLYVDASQEPAATVTLELHRMVQMVVQKHCYVQQNQPQSNSFETISFSGVNAQGYKPITMTFHKLQIDGEANDALFTVADRDSNGGLTRLQSIASDLQKAIEHRGWKCRFPPSQVQGMQEMKEAAALDDENPHNFIPRIALLRLPPQFQSHLRPLVDDNDRHTLEDGGNGISPLFWIKWEKDVMASNVRPREVGIYPRRPGFCGFDEQTFYIPHETVKLPDGNEILSEQEKIHQSYSENRIKEAEQGLRELESGQVSPDGDFVDPNLSSNRKMLESIFQMDLGAVYDGVSTTNLGNDPNSPDSKTQAIQDVNKNYQTNKVNGAFRSNLNGGSDKVINHSQSISQQPGSIQNVDMQDRIRKIIETRPSQEDMVSRNNLDFASIDQNPVFKAYRDESVVEKQSGQRLDDAIHKNNVEDPSKESLRGFWRVVRSPLESTREAPLDESWSDNFVLRVDGTVSGGPVLDQATLNKACGGTWGLIGTNLLRIRLVIPPKKERIMVWEGQVVKETDGFLNSASVLEAACVGRILQDTTSKEVIKCIGKAWIEDAVTRKNRLEIGAFVLHKVQTSSDPTDFTIIIPMSVRNQD